MDRVYEIADRISQDDPSRGERWVNDLFTTVERLETFPKSGRIVPEIQRFDIREIIYQRWRIIYKVKAHRVEILTIRPARQPLRPGDFIE